MGRLAPATRAGTDPHRRATRAVVATRAAKLTPPSFVLIVNDAANVNGPRGARFIWVGGRRAAA